MVLAQIGTEHQVLVHRPHAKDLATLWHMAQAQAHQFVGLNARKIATFKTHTALTRLHDPADGLEHCRLTGAIGTQKGNDLALLHLQRHPS